MKVGRPRIYSFEEAAQRKKEGHKKRRLVLQAAVNYLKKELGCVICKSRINLHFHHPNGVEHKKYRISNIQSAVMLLRELPKVIVECESCHHSKHAKRAERSSDGKFCYSR